MSTFVQPNTSEDNRFKTISDFKDCIVRGGETGFAWRGKTYDIGRINNKIGISESFKQETEKLYDTADELLEYLVGGDRLRDVITQVEVLYRTI